VGGNEGVVVREADHGWTVEDDAIVRLLAVRVGQLAESLVEPDRSVVLAMEHAIEVVETIVGQNEIDALDVGLDDGARASSWPMKSLVKLREPSRSTRRTRFPASA
jgi:hypothetical protein